MSNTERKPALSLSQRQAHYANRREQAACAQCVKTIEAAKHSAMVRHDRDFCAYLSKLSRYTTKNANNPGEGQRGEGAEGAAPGAQGKDAKAGAGDQMGAIPDYVLSRRRWSSIF